MNDVSDGERRPIESVVVTVRGCASGSTVVAVTGELCDDLGIALHLLITDELTRSTSALAVDLSAVTRIDGLSINALVSAAALAGESDISLCLVVANAGPVEAALAVAELTELFEIFASIDECEATPSSPLNSEEAPNGVGSHA